MTMLPHTTLLSHTTLATNHYRSYLVRFWQSNEAGCWRASAHCVQTDSTMLFGDVASLLTFLQSEIAETPLTGATASAHGTPQQVIGTSSLNAKEHKHG